MTYAARRIHRAAGLARRIRGETSRSVAQRVVRRAYTRLAASELEFPLLPGDIADSERLRHLSPVPIPSGRPLSVGWLCTPPGRGSGGHTTMFRMVSAFERAGHRCTVLLYDRHGGDPVEQAAVIRECWPWVAAEVRSVDAGFTGIDVGVATAWQTAHVLAARAPALHHAYFIQDYEPFFYPRGSEYELAADTYRFGFVNIALGDMVRDRLLTEQGVESHVVPFSCDSSVYRLENTGRRNGVVFYTKPDVPRRGYRLAALALEEFHQRHPDQEIHVYGDPVRDLTVPATRHQRLTPADLNELYNRVFAGVAMSFTNISLVAEEMLAAGCIPVVNDSHDARADIASPYVAWARATPGAIAGALCRAVERPAGDVRMISASVSGDNWTASGEQTVAILEQAVREPKRMREPEACAP